MEEGGWWRRNRCSRLSACCCCGCDGPSVRLSVTAARCLLRPSSAFVLRKKSAFYFFFSLSTCGEYDNRKIRAGTGGLKRIAADEAFFSNAVRVQVLVKKIRHLGFQSRRLLMRSSSSDKKTKNVVFTLAS